ncbi:hypothetical protein [Okeania sp. KiyG1]|uniref:hypothetical protein n=1 Tax=Okeania sp. KiyG1 TaxID=2720165 RepID=UPI001922DC94|nr:hypothetical protein [Okeania sp. KiyG1]
MRRVFLGAFENENIGGFTLRSYGWEILTRQNKHFSEAPQDENISAIPCLREKFLNTWLFLSRNFS